MTPIAELVPAQITAQKTEPYFSSSTRGQEGVESKLNPTHTHNNKPLTRRSQNWCGHHTAFRFVSPALDHSRSGQSFFSPAPTHHPFSRPIDPFLCGRHPVPHCPAVAPDFDATSATDYLSSRSTPASSGGSRSGSSVRTLGLSSW